MKPAVVLLSGGLDSTTVLAIVKEQGFTPFALTILYGQRNKVELLAAKKVSQYFMVKDHRIIELDLRLFGGSALTDDIDVAAHKDAPEGEVPQTYVPARNTIFLSLALAYAEVSGAEDIFFGANIHDYSGYSDCRPEYIEAFTKMANLAVKNPGEKNIRIHAPLVQMSKAQIIKKGLDLGVRYEMTHSCYDPIDDLACGKCSACFYRHKGFVEAEFDDPTRYIKARPSSSFYADRPSLAL